MNYNQEKVINKMNEKLRGIFPALMTPFDTNGRIKYDVLKEMLELYIENGVKGFYVNGSSGEFPLLTVDERMEILEFVKSVIKDNAVIINHIGTTSEEQSVSLAAHSKKAGADAVSSVPPFYYVYGFGEILSYYKNITKAAELPMIAYNIPALTGVSFSLENVDEMNKIEGIAGIKYTAPNYFAMERIKHKHPDFLVYNGPDEMLLAGLSMGVDGAIGTTYSFMFHKAFKVRDLLFAGDVKGAKREQEEMNTVIELLLKVGVMPGSKYLIKKKYGIDYGVCRAPRRPLTNADMAALDEMLPLI